MIINAGRSLDKYKAELKKKVDAGAETARLRFITSGSGQAMVYQEKLRQAYAFQLDPTAEAFDHIHMEATASGVTPEVTAATIIAKAVQWRYISAVIESTRLLTKSNVDAAANFAAADAAAVINWDQVLTP
jgi:hypothetical protein